MSLLRKLIITGPRADNLNQSVVRTEPTIIIINPASGLPMKDNNFCGVDTGGSPFGLNLHSQSLGSLASPHFGR